MNIKYCGEKCKIGMQKSKDFLAENNSIFDAVLDFTWFTEECFKTCPYKTEHIEADKQS